MMNTGYYPVYSWIPTYWGQQGEHRNFQCPYCYGMRGFEYVNLGNSNYQNQGSGTGDLTNNLNNVGLQDDRQSMGEQQDFAIGEESESHESISEQTGDYTNFRNQPANLNQIISIDMAINAVRERVPGLVVKAELDRANPEWVYKVDVIGMDDTMDVIEIDVNTGDILGA